MIPGIDWQTWNAKKECENWAAKTGMQDEIEKGNGKIGMQNGMQKSACKN